MFLFRSLTALSVAAVITLGVSSTDAQQGKKKKKQLIVKGVVVAVHHAKKDGDHGYLTVKVGGKKKQGGVAKEERIHVGEKTQFVKLIGKKKQGDGQTSSPATFADVHRGERVIITLHAGQGRQAEHVAINTAKKKKKSAATE